MTRSELLTTNLDPLHSNQASTLMHLIEILSLVQARAQVRVVSRASRTSAKLLGLLRVTFSPSFSGGHLVDALVLGGFDRVLEVPISRLASASVSWMHARGLLLTSP